MKSSLVRLVLVKNVDRSDLRIAEVWNEIEVSKMFEFATDKYELVN